MTDTLDRARTPLLTLITQESMDSDYQVVASRGGPNRPPAGRGLRVAVVAVVAAFALLVTVAAAQTSRNEAENDASRAGLIERIEARRGVVRGLQADIAQLRAENTAAEEQVRLLGAELGDTRARATNLAALTGFGRVTGDGVRVSIDNAPTAGEREKVRDSDLALLVNGLWEAGAEAISVNGQRLTAVTAIRNSGRAVEVNSIGIAPPYTVLAIGDQRTLAANFVETGSGLQFLAIAQQFGFAQDIDNADDLRLPAASQSLTGLRHASVEVDPKREGGEGR